MKEQRRLIKTGRIVTLIPGLEGDMQGYSRVMIPYTEKERARARNVQLRDGKHVIHLNVPFMAHIQLVKDANLEKIRQIEPGFVQPEQKAA